MGRFWDVGDGHGAGGVLIVVLTRRELLAGTAGAGLAGLVRAGSGGGMVVAGSNGSEASYGGSRDLGPLLVPVPQGLDAKVYTTERVGMSRATHDGHLRLWQGYANKTNEIRQALTDVAAVTAGASQIYSVMRGLKANYAFAWGGYVNHAVFFDSLGGEGGAPEGALMELIEGSFGSFANWAADFRATGLAGRGYVYLARDEMSGRLFNLIGDSQDTYPAWGHTLGLACDVYEHAYYLDFGANRGAYLDAFLKVVDWGAVGRRLGLG